MLGWVTKHALRTGMTQYSVTVVVSFDKGFQVILQDLQLRLGALRGNFLKE